MFFIKIRLTDYTWSCLSQSSSNIRRMNINQSLYIVHHIFFEHPNLSKCSSLEQTKIDVHINQCLTATWQKTWDFLVQNFNQFSKTVWTHTIVQSHSDAHDISSPSAIRTHKLCLYEKQVKSRRLLLRERESTWNP